MCVCVCGVIWRHFVKCTNAAVLLFSMALDVYVLFCSVCLYAKLLIFVGSREGRKEGRRRRRRRRKIRERRRERDGERESERRRRGGGGSSQLLALN